MSNNSVCARWVNHALFERLPQVALNDVLALVDTRCAFMDALEHVLGRYSHQAQDARVLRECLIAWGTNLGLYRIGECSDLTTRTLTRASENYLRLETVGAANTRIINAMAALPLFRHYDIDGVIHSSSDDQKFETERPTVKAQHSPKYFGLSKGVVAATLVANHVPVHAELISAHIRNTTAAMRECSPVRKLNTALIIEQWDELLRIFVSLAWKPTTSTGAIPSAKSR